MKLRKATAADCELLAELNHQLIRDEGHHNPMTRPELGTRMRSLLAGEYVAILVEEGKEVVAYALYREEGLSIYLRQFFVLPSHRRKGVGRQAFNSLRKEIWPRGKRITVEALLKNESGIAFWRAVGFSDYYLGLTLPPDQ